MSDTTATAQAQADDWAAAMAEQGAAQGSATSNGAAAAHAPVFEEFSNAGTKLQTPNDIDLILDRKSTRLNSSHIPLSRMPSSA